ncbi:hypothetical protein R4Q14_15415, partial [Brachyspira intermedia]|uniref:hypothetical protein n=1 Tax=Brachyspira intermedia TaxID=84377 RepID=UPI003003D383
ITNKNDEYNECIAKILYNFSYPENKEAYSHIIIQEYGLRIYIWMLKNNIWQEPFHLKKHKVDEITFLFNSNIDYESIVGMRCFSSMRLEREGGYGDFGRYEYEASINILLYELLKYYEDIDDKTKQKYIGNLDLAPNGKRYILENIIKNYETINTLGKKDFNEFDNDHINDRHDHRLERYTKKMQWIGMFQYIGWIINYLNFIPPLIKPEYLLEYYDFSTNININLQNYIDNSNTKINYDNYQYYYGIGNYITTNISDIDINDNYYLKYFNTINDSNISAVINSKYTSELLKIHKNISNINIKSKTMECEKIYIKSKLYKDGYIFVYGVESCRAETGCFGVKAQIFNEDIDMSIYSKNFILPHNFRISNNELFLFNSYFENENFVYETEEKSEYDYSGINNKNIVFNKKILDKYNIKYYNGKYYDLMDKEIILNINNLWYVHKELLLKLLQHFLKQFS